MNTKEIALQMRSLAVFRCVTRDKTIGAFIEMLGNPTASNCGEFAESLYRTTANFSRYLLNAVLLSENIVSIKKATDAPIELVISARAKAELKILQTASRVTPDDIDNLAAWLTEDLDFEAEFAERLNKIKKTGFGVFAENNMFTLEDGNIVPAIFRDNISLYSIKGYDRQKNAIDNNLKALLSGKVAANMLLYGDSGTGKSATIKAMANKYAPQGLRLIEIKKSQIDEIPRIMGLLSDNPLKFIIFLDDLTFDSSDDSFSAMKAVLEGSVAARACNTCIRGTSNRRHLVNESEADRTADDLHVKDSMEDVGALTQRFGLSIIYEKPDKAMYRRIIEELGSDMGLTNITEELFKEAEAFAISKGGRSCRTAKHFIEEVLRR